MIPANDFRRQWNDLRQDVLSAVERVGASGWYVLGEETKAFENALASYWGLKHAVGVGSGLDAIEIGLRVLGCKPGDRVLTTPLSAFATALAIVKIGAIPVFVDTTTDGLIDLELCAELLTKRSDIRYFVPVHLYGHALDPNCLRELGSKFQIQIVEDCAQSVGARFKGEPTGAAGQLAATSFYPTKNLGAMGDGGAILTNDATFDTQARILRFYGETARYRHEHLGYNSRLDEVQASILYRACLPRLDRWIARRKTIASAYLNGIQHADVRLPKPPQGSDSSWHLFPVFVEVESRDSFLTHLKGAGIATGVHYPFAIPDQPALAKARFETHGDCKIARRVCASEVSLPIHPYLTDSEVEQVIAAVNGWNQR